MDVQKLDWRTLFRAEGDLGAETIAVFDEYFSCFVALEIKDGKDGKRQVEHQNCVGCNKALTGLFGCWTWAIVHGEGQCGNCGWPSRGHHFIKNAAGEELMTLRNVILQIHPDFVVKSARSA